jgi:hypothetical protein
MADYKHGITTSRDSDISIQATQAAGVQVVIGTAPVNLLDDPAGAVNIPILVKNRGEVKSGVGLSTNYKDYTLMQAVLASLMKVGTAPIVLINVLDPSNPKHVSAVAGIEYELTKGGVTLPDEGVLLNTLVVSDGEDNTGEPDVDYVVEFTAEGFATIAVTDDGKFKEASKLTIAYTKLEPTGVTESDIIGGITEAGVRSGVELCDEVYSRFGMIPNIISAPGYSRNATVAAALEAKAELVGELTNAIAVVDVESESTTRIEDVKAAKDALGTFTRWTVLCWPKVLMGGVEIYASAAVAAMLQYLTTRNAGVPASPDNKSVPIDGVVLEGGKELHLTQKQVNNYLNAYGVLSFAYLGGWKCWGNNTAAYPDNTDPNNRFIKCVMMCNYLENRFKTEYLSSIGADGSYKTIDSIVSNYNADLNALTPDYLAGAEIVFNKEENPIAQIIEGHFVFHTKYADYTPIESIDNSFTWNSQILEDALSGGEE